MDQITNPSPSSDEPVDALLVRAQEILAEMNAKYGHRYRATDEFVDAEIARIQDEIKSLLIAYEAAEIHVIENPGSDQINQVNFRLIETRSRLNEWTSEKAHRLQQAKKKAKNRMIGMIPEELQINGLDLFFWRITEMAADMIRHHHFTVEMFTTGIQEEVDLKNRSYLNETLDDFVDQLRADMSPEARDKFDDLIGKKKEEMADATKTNE